MYAGGTPVAAVRSGGPVENTDSKTDSVRTYRELWSALAELPQDPDKTAAMGTAARKHVKKDTFGKDRLKKE
jgi:hypothetical protein